MKKTTPKPNEKKFQEMLIYVAARGRLGAIDMGTDKMVWSVTLDGKSIGRSAPDVEHERAVAIMREKPIVGWFQDQPGGGQ